MSKKRRTIKAKNSLPLAPLEILKAKLMRSMREADQRRGGVRDYTKRRQNQ